MSIAFYSISYSSVSAAQLAKFRGFAEVLASHLEDDPRIASYISSIAVAEDNSYDIAAITLADGFVMEMTAGHTSDDTDGWRFTNAASGLKLGAYYNGYDSWSEKDFPTGVYVTDSGIAFSFDASNIPVLFFTKTNADTVAIVIGMSQYSNNKYANTALLNLLYTNATSYYDNGMFAADSTATTEPYYCTTCVQKSPEASRPAMTSIAPIPILGTMAKNYCPDLFLMAFRQFDNNHAPIDINGVKYLTNGVFALKE